MRSTMRNVWTLMVLCSLALCCACSNDSGGGSSGGDGDGDGDLETSDDARDYCTVACECELDEDVDDDDLEACADTCAEGLEGRREEADDVGCLSEYDDYLECVAEEFGCEDAPDEGEQLAICSDALEEAQDCASD